MKLKDKAAWDKGVANNRDPYGAAIYRYAKKWAELIESKLDNGETVAQCAEAAGHEADTEGITGFMYGCAVGVLAHCWEHGEALRRWHNLNTQIGDEGEKANKNGGTLNPALFSIETKSPQ